VETLDGDEVKYDSVYNFGDADWEDSAMPWNFLLGQLRFRLDVPGNLMVVATNYGVKQNRDVFAQELALTPLQAESLAEKLRSLDTEEARWYAHDYIDAICTTRVRDLLDEVLGGAIREQLEGQPDGRSIRSYQREAFDGKLFAALGTDLLLGRENDVELDRYRALFEPSRMREHLQEVQVPDPLGGGGRVALAAAPVQVAGRSGPPPMQGQSYGSWWFVILGLVGLAWGARRLGDAPRLEAFGRWLFWPGLVLGVVGTSLYLVCGLTQETGFSHNELLAVFLPSDLVVAVWAHHLKRGHGPALGAVKTYARLRLALVVLVLLMHLPGVAIQRPLSLPLFVLAFFGMASWLARRAGR
jgi:hypothetical protein